MDGSTPIPEKEKDEDAMARVIEEARGYATNLSIRLANWWTAYMPLSKSLTDKLPETSESTAPENKKVETIRGSWYTNRELKKLSSTHRISNTGEDEEPKILIWLLGKTYTITLQDFDPENDSSLNQLLDDFKSQPWFTYRHHFPQLKPATFTTDSGWGCMLRTGQCLLGQALIRHRLGNSNVLIYENSYSFLDWELKSLVEPAIQEEYIKV